MIFNNLFKIHFFLILISSFLTSSLYAKTYAKTDPKRKQPSAPKKPVLDLDTEDEEDFAEVPIEAPSPSRKNKLSHPVQGGQPNTTPDPIRQNGGVSIGGSAANGVVRSSHHSPFGSPEEAPQDVQKDDLVTDFNFPDADIVDVAKALGKLTRKNLIYEKDIKGRITIISNSPVTVQQAWEAFLTALDANGFAMIQSGKYWRIARQRDARDKQLKTYTGENSPNTDALITRVFRLKYVSAEEVVRAFRNFIPTTARLIAYEQTSTVIVTDTGSNIRKLANMLEILDVEGYDAGIEVVTVKYAAASDLAKLIDTLIPGTAASGGGTGGAKLGGSLGRFSARRTKEGGIINTVIADERTNTLIVHANSKGANQVRDLVAKLDQNKPLANASGKVHVYYLQFAEAEQVASTLSNFSSQTGAGGRSGGGGGIGGSNPNATNLFQDAVKISPDKATNSLVITASPSDYFTVKRVIQSIDIPRDQVYVEAVLMDVSLSKGDNISVNAGYIPHGMNSPVGSIPAADDFIRMATSPGSLSGGLFAYPIGSSSTQITTAAGSVTVSRGMAMLQALRTYTHSNILATPQIIALDNSESTFENSEKIPVQTTTAVAGVGNTSSFTTQSVTLSLTIKPQINKLTQFVKLDVNAKMGTISNTNVPTAAQGQAFGTVERIAKTTVMAANGDTVVLGGLIRDNVEKSESKVPLLGDIPLLKWLFTKYIYKLNKTNLLIFLTPHIVRQYDKVRDLLKEKLKDRDQFMQDYFGEDYLKDARQKLDGNLPDIEELRKQIRPPSGLDEGGTSSDESRTPASASPLEPLSAAPAYFGSPSASEPSPESPAAIPIEAESREPASLSIPTAPLATPIPLLSDGVVPPSAQQAAPPLMDTTSLDAQSAAMIPLPEGPANAQ